MCCLPCCWTYDFTPALSNSWKALGWIDLTTKFRCKLFNHMFHEVKPTAFANLTWFSEKPTESGACWPSQFNTMEFCRRATVGQARPFLWPEAQRDFDATAGFVWVSYFHAKIYVYIYTHYTVCNYKMCMCIVYYRYMVRIDDRSNFFQSHWKVSKIQQALTAWSHKEIPLEHLELMKSQKRHQGWGLSPQKEQVSQGMIPSSKLR